MSIQVSSEPNLYRSETYQNYINSFHKSQQNMDKSVSDIPKACKMEDEDNDSLSSVADSLDNYLEINSKKKVRFGNYCTKLETLIYFTSNILIFPF